jgi:hypothetical protein
VVIIIIITGSKHGEEGDCIAHTHGDSVAAERESIYVIKASVWMVLRRHHQRKIAESLANKSTAAS